MRRRRPGFGDHADQIGTGTPTGPDGPCAGWSLGVAPFDRCLRSKFAPT
jgi:hypothetical protein